MGLRPNVCYRGTHLPYTRTSKVQAKDYITGIPGVKINHYEMGKKGGDFDIRIEIIIMSKGTIRHNTLESMRIVASRHLQRVGAVNFFYKIPRYPHHILRENPIATGAGADRFSQGMRASFGRPVGRACLINTGDILAFVDTTRKYLPAAKDAMKKSCYKVGLRTRVNIRELSEMEQKALKKQEAKHAREVEIEELPVEAAPGAEEEKGAEAEGAKEGEAEAKGEGAGAPKEGSKEDKSKKEK